MDNLYNQKVINATNVFDSHFLDTKTLYLYSFNKLPSLSFIRHVEAEKAYKALKEQYASMITHCHQYRWYKQKKKKYQFGRTVIVLNNECIVEFDNNYCEIMHNGQEDQFVADLTAFVNRFRERQRREPREINLIVKDREGLELKGMEIKRTALDLDLYYEQDFKEIDEVIRKRLNKKNDKGIVLLHGLPGTGKTTYLRYLVGKIKKRVLFLSPTVAGDLVNPDFVQLLIDNPNTVVIIEDAENIIADRKFARGSEVSNLLNISDGLLADFLNVQIICTFNSKLATVDSALLRQGRLIARYEFGKLSVKKAQILSDKFGFNSLITQPMTIAEIANQHEKPQQIERTRIIGFSRQNTLMN